MNGAAKRGQARISLLLRNFVPVPVLPSRSGLVERREVGQVDNLRTDCQSVQLGNARPEPQPLPISLRPHRYLRLGLLLWAATAFAAGDAQLFFSRTFPGSDPAYIEVRVGSTGDTEYREAADEELPVRFKLSEEETAAVFALAEKLDYFRHPLESPAKVAFMGTKLMRYEGGNAKSEVKFNYSEDVAAQTLLDWFERMAESAELHIDLERAAKYDHLGVMKALTAVDSAMEEHRVVGAGQFLPLLDRIANNETYMHTARARAADLAGAIRSPKK